MYSAAGMLQNFVGELLERNPAELPKRIVVFMDLFGDWSQYANNGEARREDMSSACGSLFLDTRLC